MKALRSKSFPSSPDEAYEDIMNRIELLGEWSRGTAIRAISWIFHAERRLKFAELREAIVIEPDQTDPDTSSGDLTVDELLRCCKSSVKYESASQEVTFVHSTFQQYVTSYLNGQADSKTKNNALSTTDIALNCITYLGYNEFEQSCDDEESFKDRLKRLQFAVYAARYWALHTKGEAEASPTIQKAIFRLFTSANKMNSILQLIQYANSRWGKISFSECLTFLHTVARFGLARICSILLNLNQNENDRCVPPRSRLTIVFKNC